MLKSRLITLVFATLLALTQPALADELGRQIVMQGNQKGATACLACHGAKGEGQAGAGFPRLAGLNPAYLEKQLHGFADNGRKNSIMDSIAKALSEKEIKAVSAYYAAQSPSSTPDTPTADASVIAAGKDLAMNGDWPNDIPACFACHGVDAQGIGATFPALAGQHASYIKNQIQAWKTGQRRNDPNGLMQGIARRLSPDEVKAVSAYMASLSASRK